VPVVFHHFQVEANTVGLCNAYALLPVFVRLANCLDMLTNPEAIALLTERHQLASLLTGIANSDIKEEVSTLLGMYYTAIPALGCEKLIEDKLKKPMMLLRLNDQEEVMNLPCEDEQDQQPKELSIEARRSIIAYTMWSHKASTRYTEPIHEGL
jgi:hypothetical protein